MGIEYKQAKYKWINPLTLQEISTQIDNNQNPYLDIKDKIIKVGIQAPPGTYFNITVQGESVPVEIMIGKTGILELEYEGLYLFRIELVRKKKYNLDKEATEIAISNGQNQMSNAISTYYEFDDKTGQYKLQDNKQEEEFLNTYINGYELYREGIKGIYKESNEYQEVSNVLIDYIVEVD